MALGIIAFSALWVTIEHVDPQLHNRIVDSLNRRLPLMPSSDYHLPWSLGLEIALQNPLLGVGPKNFNLYCTSLLDAGTLQATLGETACHWHAHNLYLSIAAESGLPGLVLFIALAAYLFYAAVNTARSVGWSTALPLLLIFVLFFPIQTYSQAFGQSKNFYFFTMLGFALLLIRNGLKNSNADTRL